MLASPSCMTSAVGPEGDLVEVLRSRAHDAAVAMAALLAAVAAVADAAVPGFDADEVAFALAWTRVAARRQVEFARYLTRNLPDVFAALSAGDIDTARAWVFYDQLATVDDGLAGGIAATVLPHAPGLTTSQLRDRLRRAVLKADPDAAATRTRHSVTGRYVATSPDPDGTACLYGARLPAGRAMAAFERVDAYARARKRDGDARTLDQLRADTFLDLLEGVAIGAHPIHRAGVVELTVPWATATGLGEEPGALAGYGPVAASAARDLIRRYGDRARWGYSVTGPDGSLLVHGAAGSPTSGTGRSARIARSPVACPPVESDPTRRAPGAALSRWVVARDRTCRAPGCRTPARSADIDHTRDHAEGGHTAHDNLALLCRHHHRLKHEGGWLVTQSRPGHLRWLSPTGHVYERGPDPP